MVIDGHTLWGGGRGYFWAEYMLQQSEYFASHEDSAYAMLAGNVKHPFNEFLFITVEYGIVGVVFFACVWFLAMRRGGKRPNPFSGTLLAFAVFACFSYPLRYPFVWVVSVYALSRLAADGQAIEFRNRGLFFLRIILTLLLVTALYSLVMDMRFEADWKKLSRKAQFCGIEAVLPAYDSCHACWNGNPFFLYNYGAELNRAGHYAESLRIMQECERHYNDYDIQMILADDFYNQEEWEQAENRYWLASRMCPNRFLPLQGLLNLYRQMQNREAAEETALTIVRKAVKVPSLTIAGIVADAESYLMQQGRLP